MLFNSFIFITFFAGVYSLYLALHRHLPAQNFLLLLASLIFYGYWDWRFLLLLVVSSGINFILAQKIETSRSESTRKWLLRLAILFNVLILGLFKYFNFFIKSFSNVLVFFNLPPFDPMLNIILPIGISFYTFQEMGYLVDVYRKEIKAVRNFLQYALFAFFFPQLAAGPIERAGRMFPQIMNKRLIKAEQVNAGIFLILWGYFKKLVIADNLGVIANQVFNGYQDYHGLDILIAALAFTFQIYCDFSGYSDIARGLAKLMGFDLRVNFKIPYVSRTPAEFWARWHISLSLWFKDYFYIPLGGNRKGAMRTCLNLGLTMLVAGLWHGASWNFALWGAYQGLLLIGYRAYRLWTGIDESKQGNGFFKSILQWAIMFSLTVTGWILFRAHTWDQLVYMFSHIGLERSKHTLHFGYSFIFFIFPLLAIEGAQHVSKDLLVPAKLPVIFRSFLYSVLVLGICFFSARQSIEFIYFQF